MRHSGVSTLIRTIAIRPATTARSARASRHAACALALTMAVVGGGEMSAHRRDEYLQAARVAIDPGAVDIELDLTPGIAVAEATIADIDRNGSGSFSEDEQIAYARQALGGLEVAVDGKPLRVELGRFTFPDAEAMRRGEGTIRLQAAMTFPPPSAGAHQLLFRNAHHPERSVYLANALVPESDRVEVTAQRRDGVQSELRIDYVIHPAPAAWPSGWRLGGFALAGVLSFLVMRLSRRMR
jgi:hypothetical protein